MDSLRMKVSEIEKEEITRALRESNWVMARAARTLGITERMIGYKIRKYGIRKGAVETGMAESASEVFNSR
jgi:transcriptional regulator with GAF, ATPase, and Fis domain